MYIIALWDREETWGRGYSSFDMAIPSNCLRRDLIGTGRTSVAILLLLLASCSQQPSLPMDPAASDDTRFTLVMIPKASQATFWNAVRQGAEQAQREFNVELIWKGPARENDRAAQKQVVQQFTNQGVDGILLAPTDSKALVPEVRAAGAKGISVLIFDSAIEGEVGKDFISFVATDNLAAGHLGGKHLMELIGKGGKVVLFRHLEGHESTTNREAGASNEFKAAAAEILMDNRFSGESTGEAQSTALNMMDVIRKADGIFASNQTASEGLLLALRQSNLAGKIKLVGFDCSPLLNDALRNGEINALVIQDPVNMGYASVKLMVEHLIGKPIEKVVHTGARLVTRENMDDPGVSRLLH